MSTYTSIASVTLSSAQPSVTLSGIPQTYTDLVLVSNAVLSSSVGFGIYFNGDTGSNYSFAYMYGDGTSAASGRNNNTTRINIGNGGTTYSTYRTNIQNYSNSTTFKTVVSNGGMASEIAIAFVGTWRDTSAINSLTIVPASGNINSGTTFNLYGINAANSAQAKATGGNSIYRDSSYWYHVFTSSGTLTPSQSLSNVDYLVVAGGGGGGNSAGGGGGAGGLRSTIASTGGGGSVESKLSLSASTSYIVTVGAGGSAGYPSAPTSGGNSSIIGGSISITSTGGGYGGGNTSSPNTGANGGSGGGSTWNGSGGTNGAGTGTNNQGYAGGAGTQSGPPYKGGGGGGAGGAGSTPNGGNGVANSITGSSINYAGGGGGGSTDSNAGSGGSGGGGNGGTGSPTATAGTVNSGGGGGGSGGTNNPAAGGSGIVIVRYSV